MAAEPKPVPGGRTPEEASAASPDAPPASGGAVSGPAAFGVPFSTDGFHGALAPAWAEALSAEEVADAVGHLTDPARAVETLHWGRNYLYVSRVDGPAAAPSSRAERAPVPVVVKQFRNESVRARVDRRLRGSKAERSWRAAAAVMAAGVRTPEPVMHIESEALDGPSFYVCRYLEAATEARYLLRAANAGEEAERFPGLPMEEFLDRFAELVARLHAEGIWFRDMTSGNVLVRGSAGRLELFLVDLNRARPDQPMTLVQRTRDLSRMPIHRPEHQEHLLRAYWTGRPDRRPAGWVLKKGLYLLYHRAFLAKNRAKEAVRGAFRGLRNLLVGRVLPRGTHAHIPQAPGDAPSRERVVWDHLSDQPHLHATPLEKLATRLGDARSHLEQAGVVALAAPRILRRYRELQEDLHRAPVPVFGPAAAAGVALRPWPEDPEGLLALVAGLKPDPPGGAGRLPVMIRLHPWEPEGIGAEEELAAELAGRGHEVSFAVPQNRDLVREPERWRAAVEVIAERLAPHGRSFQIGQAINRSKWGVWTMDEYAELVGSASEILRRARPDAEILGPAVIDFEYHVTAAAANLKRDGLAFDVLSALLYVDRRGAPEARQSGFDTVDKVALLKAIGDTGGNVGGGDATARCWITEVNWPLREGPHSPAGRSVSVDEETQADYLVRYLLLALGTGLVERVFWWQMLARGYGLACPEEGGLRRRPAYRSLATLLSELGRGEGGATFTGPLPAAGPARLYGFRRPAHGRERPGGREEEVVVGWSAGDAPAEAVLPRRAVRALGRDGREELPPDGTAVDLSPSPRYFVLE